MLILKIFSEKICAKMRNMESNLKGGTKNERCFKGNGRKKKYS